MKVPRGYRQNNEENIGGSDSPIDLTDSPVYSPKYHSVAGVRPQKVCLTTLDREAYSCSESHMDVDLYVDSLRNFDSVEVALPASKTSTPRSNRPCVPTGMEGRSVELTDMPSDDSEDIPSSSASTGYLSCVERTDMDGSIADLDLRMVSSSTPCVELPVDPTQDVERQTQSRIHTEEPNETKNPPKNIDSSGSRGIEMTPKTSVDKRLMLPHATDRLSPQPNLSTWTYLSVPDSPNEVRRKARYGSSNSLRIFEELEFTDISDYHIMEFIARGSFGKVNKAIAKCTNQLVVIKEVNVGGSTNVDEEPNMSLAVQREIKIQWACDHPNIARLKCMATGPQSELLYFVMEYAGEDMLKLLAALKQPFSILELKALMADLLSGVSYLHQHGYMHRDIKPANLLLATTGVLKIADFGLAREIVDQAEVTTTAASPQEEPCMTPVVVTLWYRAPEVLLKSQHYGTAVDMWSIGCVMAELATRKTLFRGRSEFDQMVKIFALLGTPSPTNWPESSVLPGMNYYRFQPAPKRSLRTWLRNKFQVMNMSDCAFDLLGMFLRLDPRRRVSCEEALRHRWFMREPSLIPELRSRRV